jgi:hypothetical protein
MQVLGVNGLALGKASKKQIKEATTNSRELLPAAGRDS